MNSGVVMSEAVVRHAVSNWHVLAVVAVAAAVTFGLRYTGVKGADQVAHRPLMQFFVAHYAPGGNGGAGGLHARRFKRRFRP